MNGIVRSLPEPFVIETLAAARRTARGESASSVLISSEGAAGIRVNVDARGLPDGSRIYLYSVDQKQVFGPYTAHEQFWTNTIFGDSAVVQLSAPHEIDAKIKLVEVVHIIPEIKATNTDCLRDAMCASTTDFVDIEWARNTVARLSFIKGGNAYLCTGTLIPTTVENDNTPYFITANHCIDSQASASSLELFWRYTTPSCGAAFPDPSTAPRTLGATLLSNSADSDYAFLRLSQTPPAGVKFSGWDANDYSGAFGKTVHSLHHPLGAPMSYSRGAISTQPNGACVSSPRGRFVWSQPLSGGTAGGSSGGPLFIVDNQNYSYVIGQLQGICTGDGNECGSNLSRMDGSFAATYPSIARWLDPTATTTCTPSGTTMCLNNNRFKVEVTWQDFSGNRGNGNVVQAGTADSGLFWFFASSNWEMLVKVLNGCPVNGKYWVFAAATTNVGYTLTVTDLKTGATKQYTNPLGTSAAATTDTNAFPSCP